MRFLILPIQCILCLPMGNGARTAFLSLAAALHWALAPRAGFFLCWRHRTPQAGARRQVGWMAFNPKRPAFDDGADGLLQKSKVIDTVAGKKEWRC